jgi:hypothetical protein
VGTNNHPAFESGILDPEYHKELVADIDSIAATAGLGKSHVPLIYTPLTNLCGPEEREWLTEYSNFVATGDTAGIFFSGVFEEPSVLDRMLAMTACFLRNYVDARILTVQEVLSILKAGGEVKGSVLFIPNFYLPSSAEGSIPKWQISDLYGLLLSRHRDGLQTVLYVKNKASFEADYGQELARFVISNYLEFEG